MRGRWVLLVVVATVAVVFLVAVVVGLFNGVDE